MAKTETEIPQARLDSFSKELARIAVKGHTKEERERIEENRRRLRKELPPITSPEVLMTRVGPGPSGEVLMTRIGPNCADFFFAQTDEDQTDEPRSLARFIHDLPLGENPQALDES